jgi:hypothetical protein
MKLSKATSSASSRSPGVVPHPDLRPIHIGQPFPRRRRIGIILRREAKASIHLLPQGLHELTPLRGGVELRTRSLSSHGEELLLGKFPGHLSDRRPACWAR